MSWATLYPAFAEKSAADEEMDIDQSRGQNKEDQSQVARSITKDVEIADIGCGFGGLLFALAEKFPDTLALGMCSLVMTVRYHMHQRNASVPTHYVY